MNTEEFLEFFFYYIFDECFEITTQVLFCFII